MAANDHLSPDQFFHGTHARLSPGDAIEPGHEPNFPVDGKTYPEPGQVYFTSSRKHAEGYADRVGSRHGVIGRVYRVEPTGDYQPHYSGAFRSGNSLRVLGEEDG
jgi:sugar lactone lactonase YvrE